MSGVLKCLLSCGIALLGTCAVALSDQAALSLDLQNVSMQDALHILAKVLHENIIISPQISGTTSLHLNDVGQQEAFDLLIASHDLVKQKIGKVWWIVPRAEALQRQQEQIKWQAMLDDVAPLITRVWQIHYAKADDIGNLLQDSSASLLSKRGHVRIDLRTNKVCVQDTQEHILAVQHVVAQLDVPVQQILIEARLASIDNNFERELGINFNVISTHDGPVAAKHYSLAVANLADGSQLDVQLAALEKAGHGELISSPSLFTANQQTASIESGEEIPYQESTSSGATSVTFKKAVLSLKVTPQIMPGNKVLLQLQVNQDRPSDQLVLGVPAINTRQISTHVLLENSQTIVLGGIYEVNQENAEQRVPFFGKLPLVGWLFKQQNISNSKRELLIFVTPKIITQNQVVNDKA